MSDSPEIQLPDSIDSAARICVGRVGCPAGQEATSDKFHFWIPSDALVEKSQLVTCGSTIAGEDMTFYAIVDEVRRSSRKRSMGQEFDEADGDLNYTPPFQTEGCTWAEVSILRTEPPLFTPPRERSEVLLARAEDARLAYRADEIDEEKRLPIGLIKNGGREVLGPGVIDLNYLLGVNGGHLNVNGAAGRGTKSSFLLFINWLLLRRARREQQARPSAEDRLRVVPIILNVKGHDLFYIDRPSNRFDEEKHGESWRQLGEGEPAPFEDVEFYAMQQAGSNLAVAIRGRSDVKPFSWSLKDVIDGGLLPYLFADEDAGQANFSVLVHDIAETLTHEHINNDGSLRRELNATPLGVHPPSFQGLLEFIKDEGANQVQGHYAGTWKKLYRRLLKLLYESKGVLRRKDLQGHPLRVVRQDNSMPIVIDLSELSGSLDLQRFVVATILRQLVDSRTGTNRVSGLVYLVTLDELNRFAPRGSHDEITRLVEQVAAEMRSQGIILLGAQQQASLVSQRVVENCAIRAIGKSGSLELSQAVWQFISPAARRKAESLLADEKLIVQDNFREPMHVRVPFPAWAMNPDEAFSPARSTPGGAAANGVVAGGAGSSTASVALHPVGPIDED
ncbi:MAG TPA: hypothetical protein VNA16_01640 [Abditibacteriaceae bacterium]|nr:hypothetical protein [Abditibacteriaceae bacterium]